MIYSDKKITASSIKVRFYSTDPDSGHGDLGLSAYRNIRIPGFIETRECAHDNTVYYTYHFTKEMAETLCKIFGNQSYFISHNYEMATPAKRNAEIAEAERMLDATKYYYI